MKLVSRMPGVQPVEAVAGMHFGISRQMDVDDVVPVVRVHEDLIKSRCAD